MAATATAPVTTATTMPKVSRSHRIIAGVCLILGPIAQIYRTVPRQNLPSQEMLAWIGQNTTDFLIHCILYQMVAMLLFVPAYLGLAHLMRERAPKLGLVGSAFGILSCIALYAMGAINLAFYKFATSGLDQGIMAQLMEQMGNSPLFLIVAGPFLLSLVIGTICIVTGLWRSRVVPRAALLFVIAAIVIDVFAPNVAFLEIAKIPLFFGYGWIGLRILKMTDAEWEHPPVVA